VDARSRSRLGESQPLPQIDGERCVHSRLAQAVCRRCVDACPTGAWVIDDERLGFDSGRCDGCGLCAPACPEGAIAAHSVPVVYRIEGRGVAFAACARAAVGEGADGEGLVPCLHGLGVHGLLGLYRQGLRLLLTCRGDCGTCPRGGALPLEASLGQAGALIADRGLEPLLTRGLGPEHWRRSLAAARRRHRGPALGRRAFFRGLLARVEPAAPDTPAERLAYCAPGRLLPDGAPGTLALFAPRIDPTRCTGCDACVRLCAHGVIAAGEAAYRLDPSGCTGCGVCAEVCGDSAIAVHALDPLPQRSVLLHGGRCPACGADYRSPLPIADPRALCPICARTNRHRNLFQRLAVEAVGPAEGPGSDWAPPIDYPGGQSSARASDPGAAAPTDAAAPA
jgi:Pyruvate/2-oxoacid:ferredoxin oxidoreductase delta subunit